MHTQPHFHPLVTLSEPPVFEDSVQDLNQQVKLHISEWTQHTHTHTILSNYQAEECQCSRVLEAVDGQAFVQTEQTPGHLHTSRSSLPPNQKDHSTLNLSRLPVSAFRLDYALYAHVRLHCSVVIVFMTSLFGTLQICVFSVCIWSHIPPRRAEIDVPNQLFFCLCPEMKWNGQLWNSVSVQHH